MLVSIITPLFNSEKTVVNTYNSICCQTVQDWEWIVVDDCSTDDSYKILEELSRTELRIILLKNKSNKGPGFSRNEGIKIARGRFLTFIDSDDFWYSSFLEVSLRYIVETNSGFVFSSYERWNESMTKMIDTFYVPNKVSRNSLLYTCPISCLTAFIDIEKLGKKYMPDIRKRQDFALWLDYLSSTDFAYGIPMPLAKYRLQINSVSSNKFSVIKYQYNIYRSHLKLSHLKSIYYLSFWMINGIIKYRIRVVLKINKIIELLKR